MIYAIGVGEELEAAQSKRRRRTLTFFQVRHRARLTFQSREVVLFLKRYPFFSKLLFPSNH